MNKKATKRLLWGEFSIKRVVSSMISIPIIIYIFLLLYALFLSDRMIFRPHPSSYQDSSEILKLTAKDGVQISAFYLPNPNATYTILYSHGNAEDLGDNIPDLREIRDMGYAVFAYDYHGYGTSQGEPSEKSIYMDIDAAYDYLTLKLGVAPDRIISYGRSVGGGPAVDLASRKPVAGLIVESSFTTAFRVLTRIPILPFDKFRNVDKLEKVNCPVLIIHGRADQVISFEHGEKLFKYAREPKRYLWIDEADHNNLRWAAGELYSKALQEFSLLLSTKAERSPN